MTYIKLTKIKSLALFLVLIFTIDSYANIHDISPNSPAAEAYDELVSSCLTDAGNQNWVIDNSPEPGGYSSTIGKFNGWNVAWIATKHNAMIAQGEQTCISKCMLQSGTYWQVCYWQLQNMGNTLTVLTTSDYPWSVSAPWESD